MDRALGLRNTKVVFTLVIALSALAGSSYGQIKPRLTPETLTYTETVNCPDASKLLAVTQNIPAGWTLIALAQLELNVVEATPSQIPPGKQALACHYKAKDCAGCTGAGKTDVLVLRRIVDLDSCMNSVPSQPKKSFLCKPGVGR